MWFQSPLGYKVGYSKFIAPVPAPFSIGNAKLKSTGEPALLLEEVAFSVYYPAKYPNESTFGVEWLTRPLRGSFEGYTHFSGLRKWLVWPIVYLFGSRLRMPVYLDAPLQRVESLKEHKWPLVIFSHGLGGSCTAYSQVCSALAASGKVVLAIEHRDGSAHACPASLTSGGVKTGNAKIYLTDAEIKWEQELAQEPPKFRLRADQLLFRRHEVYLAYQAFSSFTGGERTLLTTEGAQASHGDWIDAVENSKDVALVGHSFGGATTLSILSNDIPTQNHARIPITKAVILDPWLEPLPSPGPSPYAHSKSDGHRLLTINSEGFTLWKPHFERLKEVVGSWGRGGHDILTIVKSQHASFSDFKVLPYTSNTMARNIMNTITGLTIAFLDHEDYQKELSLVVKPLQFEETGAKKKDGSPQLRVVGEPGSIVA